MEKVIYTYALVKSLCDQGEDYIDSFWPFAIKSLPADRSVDSSSIQRNLKETFAVEMPLHVLQTILNRAKRKGYIERREKRYALTEKGLEYRDKVETEKEVERRITALLEDMRRSFQDHEVSLTLGQVSNLLLAFLHSNVEPLIQFINPSASLPTLDIPKPEGHENLLVEYFKTAEERKPENYATLRDMILGSVISVVLYAREPSQMTEIGASKFEHTQVFLDTNFVLYVLGLHTPEFNEPAAELFHLLKKWGFHVRIFGFTVDEICRVISGYPRYAHRYPYTIGVNTLYSSLRRQGWVLSTAREFITNIERILRDNGIAIEWAPEIDLKNYTCPDEGLRNLMRQYKPEQDFYYQNHDLAAIDKMRELRGKPMRRIEDSKAFFLSSDARLSRFNFIEMGHRDSGTVCEVILDRLLTNILWLKDPSAGPSLESIVAAYSRDLFIKRRVWDRFYDALRQLRQEGKVEDEEISMLFYHGYVEDVLRPLDEAQAGTISGDFVLQEIEKAAKFREEAEEARIREKEKEFFKRLKEAVSTKEEEKEREWLERIREIKGSLRESAQRDASRISTIGASAVTLLVFGAIYLVYLALERAGLSQLWNVASVAIGGSGIYGLWVSVRRRIGTVLANRIYAQGLGDARLDE